MKSLCLFAAIVFLSWTPSVSSYSDLDALYSDFVVMLKQDDEQKLKDYCFAITPDSSTVAWMKKHNFNYRGIPNELEAKGFSVTAIGEHYYKRVRPFKEKLQRNGQLDNLEYLGREREGDELVNEELDIRGTETFILLRSGSDTIRCKLGEMFRVNGKWKSFTDPKLGW
ncbi:MAG: hypothetical protein K0Q66_1872 [Chitinophagaceae bacterium]|jgi:hypothetical protein|nr:hypothetical protein [Chitinophagaceae bacterium]